MNYLDAKSNSPKYWQLAERFRKQLKSGALKPGDRLPTLIEMRDDHNISRTTVEKAYGLLERDGLIERLHGSGVFVSQPRRRSTQGTIGLSGLGFGFQSSSPYWSQLLGGIHQAAAREEMQLLVLDPRTNRGWEKADGVLLCDWNDERMARKELPGLPTVSLLMDVPGMASVVADDYAGMQLAVQHLLDLGHRKIGYLHAHNSSPILWNRMNAFRDTLKSAGLRRSDGWTHLLHGSYDYGASISRKAYQEMSVCLREGWSTLALTALICHNDEAALGAMRALGEAGLKVPGDISVMGFDGTELCDLVSPRLSSIELPLREIGATAVEMLLRQIQQDAASDEHQILPVALKKRETTVAISL